MVNSEHSMRRALRPAVGQAAALSCALLLSSSALAQDRVAGGFEPATDLRASAATVVSPVATDFNQLDVATTMSYGRNPLLVSLPGGLRAPLVRDALGMHVLASYGVWEDLSVGLDVPAYFFTAGVPGAPGRLNADVAVLGDIRIEPRYRIWGLPSKGLDVGVALGVALPTGDQARYAGAGLRGHLRGLVAVRPLHGLELVGNTGVLDGLDAMGSITWGAAGLYRISATPLSLLAELDGRLGYEAEQISSLDARAGVRVFLGDWILQGGPSFAVLSATGHSQFGGFVGVARGIGLPKRVRERDEDADKDGLPNATDACRALAEDADEFQDADGCPDADNDGDGIVDRFDAAPMQAEDRDGFEDADGAPEAATLAPAAASTVVTQVIDADADGDGLTNAADRCPGVSGPLTTIGCPDADADFVVDADDKCADQPGSSANAGCPMATKAVLAADRIEITSTIEFAVDTATLSSASKPMLDQVAALLQGRPSIERLRIEGHADLQGTSDRNAGLSQARAEAVLRALVERGVAASRLRAVGMGTARPLVTPEVTDADRAKNRRVEFHIVHIDEETP